MSSSGVVSKKLKFKGDKSKKKKRSHNHSSGAQSGRDELEALAAADPTGWMFPAGPNEINGPAYILLPTEPLTCLAWDPHRQRVHAVPVEIPQAPEGANDLSEAEILQTIEPTDVNHVWVVSRLSGSEDVISLRTSTGTFLTAEPSGSFTATTPSRGPLEAFIPLSSPTSSDLFPAFSFQTQHGSKFFSAPSSGAKVELRADADESGANEGLRIKCQREFVWKARAGDDKLRGERKGIEVGRDTDELRRQERLSRHDVKGRLSAKDRDDVQRNVKEGRYAEAMLDRRAAQKSDRYAK
ncbi:hypothetical protein B9479_004226 [Cryptococcus floricola]|uniref:Protein FRG1 n=1 Tax=Cryptococcus floricola TaxID=2591691 RepID=A0A5D3AWG7_9TREE|nr:hypothetical protein B9479_004226 [Cryptococcus floricola]